MKSPGVRTYFVIVEGLYDFTDAVLGLVDADVVNPHDCNVNALNRPKTLLPSSTGLSEIVAAPNSDTRFGCGLPLTSRLKETELFP